VGQLVEALCFKPEGRGFDSQLGHWNSSLTLFFRLHYVPVVDSATNRNEYHGISLWGKGGRWLRLTILPPSFVE